VTEPLPAILDGWEQPVTAIERAALAVDPHVSLSSHEPGEFGGTCPDCMAALRYIRRLLKELREGGHLPPEGSERRVQLMIRWYFPDGRTVDWGAEELVQVREMLLSPADGRDDLRFEVLRRSHWAGPWEVAPEEEINGG
jgi:hypothetical protein